MWGAKQVIGGGRSTGRIPPMIGTEGAVDADFSDHFVVRRQPVESVQKELPAEADPSETDFICGSETKIGDQKQSSGQDSKCNIKTTEGKMFSKILTPFQIGKRSKIPGYVSILEGRKAQIDAVVKTSPLYSSFKSNLQPVPGRAYKISEPHMVPSSASRFAENSTPVVSQQSQAQVKSAEPNVEIEELDSKLDSNNNLNRDDSKPGDWKDNGVYMKQASLSSQFMQKTTNKTLYPSKPNVYRNPNYTPSTYYPLLPGPVTTPQVSSYQSQYLARHSAKGDAPGVSHPEIPETTGGNGIRPRTAGDQLQETSSVPRPMTASPACNFLPKPPKPGMFYHPMMDNHKSMVHSKIPRNELASPLSPFHAPIRPFVLPQEDENYGNSYLNGIMSTWRHSIFRTCSQKGPIPMALVFDYLANIRKCGEGVYGEVFKAYYRGLTEQRVYKVVPIEGSKIVNGEKQKKFTEIEQEIIVSQELNRLRDGYNGCFTDGHCKLLFTRIIQGKYPQILVDQWKAWHRTYVSQNDLPSFDVTQMYAIFEFEFHGADIESYKFRNAKQSLAVLLNVMHALAAAEAAMEFEHRDLHWGNILVVKTREPYSTYTIQGTTFRVPNCGLKSTIIDYTISRLTSSSGETIFTDLANDEDQFCGSEDYQFEIYRMMRQENQNDWSKFCPKTNIFWSHYLVGKLIDKGRYQDTTSATHLRFKNKLFRIQSNLLKYASCMECARRFLSPFCRDVETDCM